MKKVDEYEQVVIKKSKKYTKDEKKKIKKAAKTMGKDYDDVRKSVTDDTYKTSRQSAMRSLDQEVDRAVEKKEKDAVKAVVKQYKISKKDQDDLQTYWRLLDDSGSKKKRIDVYKEFVKQIEVTKDRKAVSKTLSDNIAEWKKPPVEKKTPTYIEYIDIQTGDKPGDKKLSDVDTMFRGLYDKAKAKGYIAEDSQKFRGVETRFVKGASGKYIELRQVKTQLKEGKKRIDVTRLPYELVDV